MTRTRTLNAVICAAALVALFPFYRAAGQTGDAAPPATDIYGKIDILCDSLMAWSSDTLTSGPRDTLISASLLNEILEVYSHTSTDTVNGHLFLILAPPEHAILGTGETRLWLESIDSGRVYRPVLIDDWAISDISTVNSSGGQHRQTAAEKRLLAYVKMRSTFYSFLGLPPPIWSGLSGNLIGASMSIHGRDIDTIRFSRPENLLISLNRMLEGLWCYVKPLRQSIDTASFEAEYLIYANHEASSAAHLFLVVESGRIGDRITDSPISVDLHAYPFIRDDNVLDLYDTARGPEDSVRVRLPIRR